MSRVNQMLKNNNQLTLKLYQFPGKLIFPSSWRSHTEVGGWVHIRTEKCSAEELQLCLLGQLHARGAV